MQTLTSINLFITSKEETAVNKKLEIGDEIVIYPEKEHLYKSFKIKNGCKTQVYNSSNFPETLTAVFMGREEGKDGRWYEKYTLKIIPEELKDFRLEGQRGFNYLIEELNKISEILQGTAEDGRKILYPRSIKIEDINEILGVVVDFQNRQVYQKINPSENINKESSFGTRRTILSFEVGRCMLKQYEFIKGNQIESTGYWYSIYDLAISEKRKEIVQLNFEYHLASRFVNVYPYYTHFCESYVLGANTHTRTDLFYSEGYEDSFGLAVLPVFYLEEEQEEAEILEEIKKQQEKIGKMQEDLKKEEKELEKMLEKTQKLV